MTNHPLISVVIPVYNSSQHLTNCLNSVVNQSYKRLEIIIVDDGSTDLSGAICDEFAEKDNRITVIHQANAGAAAARNAGLDIATGDYIGFVDSDDYLDNDMYESLLKELIVYQADAARCGIVRELPDGTTEDWGTGNHELYVVEGVQLLRDVGEAFGILPVSPCNKLFKKECIGGIRFDTRYRFAEDTLFNFMVARNIDRMVYHDINRYHYVVNTSSMTQKTINENNFDEHRVMDVIFTLADRDTLPYCVKGDVLKSFRTIRQMITADKYMDRFHDMRRRIVKHKKAIFFSGLYSSLTKLRTLLLWLCPPIYQFTIKRFRK